MNSLSSSSHPIFPAELEARLLAFDVAWQGDKKPSVADFIEADDPEEYVKEVIRIDIERRRTLDQVLTEQEYAKVLPLPWNQGDFLADMVSHITQQPATLQLHTN